MKFSIILHTNQETSIIDHNLNILEQCLDGDEIILLPTGRRRGRKPSTTLKKRSRFWRRSISSRIPSLLRKRRNTRQPSTISSPTTGLPFGRWGGWTKTFPPRCSSSVSVTLPTILRPILSNSSKEKRNRLPTTSRLS